jgi:hypothetical protein
LLFRILANDLSEYGSASVRPPARRPRRG